MTYIIGISCFYHDSAAALLCNGEIVGAAHEERFSRIKHDSSFPINSIKFLLESENIKLSEIDYIVFYEKPFLKFERILETYIQTAPYGYKSFSKSMPIWIKDKLFLKNTITNKLKELDSEFNNNKIYFSEHHLSHAASAFFPSPFKKAIILTLDGVGEWATTTISLGDSNRLDIIKEINFPHSIGLLYSAFTYYLGFKVNSGEYKVMGLAPYGIPKYKKIIFEKLIDVKNDGSFKLNLDYFGYMTELKMISKARNPEKEPINQFHMDIAASIQFVVEEIILKMTNNIQKEYDCNYLCMAGGVALNCVANGKILQSGSFKDLWIQPAAGDAGGSLGAALAFWHLELKKNRSIELSDQMKGSYLGPKYSMSYIKNEFEREEAKYFELSEEELINYAVNCLLDKKIIGWFQGKMEFGPRALGARSIIADPRDITMQKKLNLSIKYRETFRPFAPSILKDEVHNWFDYVVDSPYMLLVDEIKKDKKIKMSQDEINLFGIDKLNIKRSEVPAVTHVDYSARIQTVDGQYNKRYYKLLKSFFNRTGCPMIINTSFNVRGEPIVNEPIEAFNCFMGTEIDVLICENFILEKSSQTKKFDKKYKYKYKLD
jgi:carbamoyltransferase